MGFEKYEIVRKQTLEKMLKRVYAKIFFFKALLELETKFFEKSLGDFKI